MQILKKTFPIRNLGRPFFSLKKLTLCWLRSEINQGFTGVMGCQLCVWFKIISSQYFNNKCFSYVKKSVAIRFALEAFIFFNMSSPFSIQFECHTNCHVVALFFGNNNDFISAKNRLKVPVAILPHASSWYVKCGNEFSSRGKNVFYNSNSSRIL